MFLRSCVCMYVYICAHACACVNITTNESRFRKVRVVAIKGEKEKNAGR